MNEKQIDQDHSLKSKAQWFGIVICGVALYLAYDSALKGYETFATSLAIAIPGAIAAITLGNKWFNRK